ncbi:MAG: UvrD-helicase domain-containing protein [Clostridium butyricum]|uniref:UvrD-helicase domain-containing protein n=1 Tax=Clostridium butyricum TaxID=1492 RepID=UPI001CAA210A|nr:ATP-dependent helicase [Clostridium butyricum]MBZ0312176.1 ATP-dependent helicase [Clostridium butyricum]MDU4749534.1 ATP-dependent helicase [Clostridium butyricum]MDU4853621.1 ATP-dependent helicase [Clostridioides difficile]
MANEIEKNIYLVNAPAGSGKTTKIKEMLNKHTISFPEDNILCITYTNRAVDELKNGINNNHIFISTIHSFINTLIAPFYGLDSVKELYWNIFGERIQDRIKNECNDKDIEKSNNRYIEKNGELSIKVLKKNIKYISYGETEFTSLYYGKLSHDDLLLFARKLMERYPKIREKISIKFQLIFIDEYQDTSANVLNIFYEAVRKTDTKLFFLGDKMQQIYKTYDGSFEETFSKFNTEMSLQTNHRSIPTIVNILNKLYNNPMYEQEVYEKNRDKQPEYNPRVILSDDIHKDIEVNLKKYPDTLVLYLFNSERFKEIGAETLWKVYSGLDPYGFARKYSASNVLVDTSEDNPDEMMKFLFKISEMNFYWINHQYGNIIVQCRKNKKYFNITVNTIVTHSDKNRIKSLWSNAFEIFNDSARSIRELVQYLVDNQIIIDSCLSIINPDNEYDRVLDVPICEVKSLYNYLKEPHISTQHGVKGESHDTVVFVATDSYHTPIVYMYKFFEVWAKIDFSLNEFEDFYYSYSRYVSDIQISLGIKTSDLNAKLHNQYKTELMQQAEKILDKFKDNKLFESIAKGAYEDYLSRQTLSNIKKCFKDNTVYGVLSAYRLFYVGCSRSRKNVTVIVDKSKVNNFIDQFVEKCKKFGFSIN